MGVGDHEPMSGRYAYDGIDRVLHAPARLGIVTALYAHQNGLTFVEIRRACELTDGNLSRQLRRLEDEQVVSIEKRFVDRVPQTLVTLTESGRRRFDAYLATLEALVEENRSESVRTAGLDPETG